MSIWLGMGSACHLVVYPPHVSNRTDQTLTPFLRCLKSPLFLAVLTAPSDVFRALAQVRASQGRRSSAISLFHRAAAAGRRSGDDDDPLSLCGLARLLLAPYHNQHPRRPVASSSPLVESNAYIGGQGRGGAAEDRPETGIRETPLPIAPRKAGVCLAEASALPQEEALRHRSFPSDDNRNKAARLLARAFASLGGELPPENVWSGGQGGDGPSVDDFGGIDALESEAEQANAMVLAEVYLLMSRFNLNEGREGRESKTRDECGDGAKEWHLQQAVRVSSPNSKTGIIARCESPARRVVVGYSYGGTGMETKDATVCVPFISLHYEFRRPPCTHFRAPPALKRYVQAVPHNPHAAEGGFGRSSPLRAWLYDSSGHYLSACYTWSTLASTAALSKWGKKRAIHSRVARQTTARKECAMATHVGLRRSDAPRFLSCP